VTGPDPSHPPASMSKHPSLAFSLDRLTLFITDDPSRNERTLFLANRTGSDLALRGGVPVPEGDITPSGPTSIYLSFGDLLSDEEMSSLHITAEGWVAAYFGGTFAGWALCPREDLALRDGDGVSFAITGLRVGGQPRPGTLTVDSRNVPGLRDDSVQLKVVVQNPHSGLRDLALDHTFLGGNVVYTTEDEGSPIRNRLYFALSNPSPDSPLVSPDTPWGPRPPIFNVSFVFASPPGYGALTTPGSTAFMTLDLAEQHGDDWEIEKRALGDVPWWQIRPRSHEVLGTGVRASVELVLGDLVVDLPVGDAPDVTLVYVQYANVPGYNDGFLTLEVVKDAGPAVVDFWADPANVPLGTPQGTTTLHWKTRNADEVSFQGAHIPDELYGPEGQGPLADLLSVRKGDEITVTAHRRGGGGSMAREASGGVSVSRTLRIGGAFQAGTGFAPIGAILAPKGTARAVLVQTDDWGATKLAFFDLKDHHVHDAVDLASVIDPERGTQHTTRSVCASPDGRTVYAVVQTRKDEESAWYTTSIVALDVETRAARLGLSLGELTAFSSPNLLVSPDGSALVVTSVLGSEAHRDVVVIDPADFQVVRTFEWPFALELPNVPQPLGLDRDARRLFVHFFERVSVMSLDEGMVLGEIDMSHELGKDVLILGGLVSPDASRVYCLAWHEGRGKYIDPPQLQVMSLTVDPVTGSISVAERAELKRDRNGQVCMTLSPDGRNLYVAPPDRIVRVDTGRWIVEPVISGSDGAFVPRVLALDAQGEVLLASGHVWEPDDKVTIVNVPRPHRS